MAAVDSATAILSTATAVADAPSPETTVDDSAEAPVAIPEAIEESSQPEEQIGGAESQPEAGQRAMPSTQQLRSALKAFREANPEHAQAAKLLNDGYSRYEAYKQVIPTVDEARTIRATLDTVGGLEGLAELQSLSTSIEETDSLLEEGNPEILDQILEDAPEGFRKLAGPYLSKLAKVDPESYAKATTPHFVRFLTESNFPGVLQALARAVSDKPEALEIVRDMGNWFDREKALAERLSADTLSPERDKLAKDRETFTKEQRQAFEQSIGQAMNPHINQELGGRLKQYAYALNALPIGQRQAVARACMSELAAALEADQAYQSLITPLMGARKPNKDKIISLNKAQVSKLADAVVGKVAKDFGLRPGAIPNKNTNGKGKQAAPQSTSIIKIAKQPKDSEIDWNYPDSHKAFILHRAKLVDGRMVEWPR